MFCQFCAGPHWFSAISRMRKIFPCYGLSIQAMGPMLFLGRTSLHCRKVGAIPAYGWATHCMLRKLHVTNCSSKPKCMFLALARQLLSKTAQKALSSASAYRIRWFHWALHHQIAECTSACPTPLISNMLKSITQLCHSPSVNCINLYFPQRAKIKVVLNSLKDR